MSRSLTTAQENAIEAGDIRLAFFAELEYGNNDFVRAWTGFDEIQFDSDGDGNDETFIGVGDYAGFDRVSETAELKAQAVRLSLLGVPVDDSQRDALDDALREDYHGKPGKVWMGVLDDSFNLIDEPIKIEGGFMDVQKVKDSGSELSIEVILETPLRDLRRKATVRYTTEDQQKDFPNDRFFDHVEDIQDKNTQWNPNEGN